MKTDPIKKLRRCGEIVLSADGTLLLGGLPLRLLRWIDAQLLKFAGGMSEIQCPSLIEREVLERAG
jgi:hypothetical protein